MGSGEIKEFSSASELDNDAHKDLIDRALDVLGRITPRFISDKFIPGGEVRPFETREQRVARQQEFVAEAFQGSGVSHNVIYSRDNTSTRRKSSDRRQQIVPVDNNRRKGSPTRRRQEERRSSSEGTTVAIV